jgi:hypothetical protein
LDHLCQRTLSAGLLGRRLSLKGLSFEAFLRSSNIMGCESINDTQKVLIYEDV